MKNGARPPSAGLFVTLFASMLDLAYVREHLAVVEEKLRQRGLDPTQVLGKFREVDEARRRAIVELEAAQQKRNQLSQRIGELKRKKDGTDAERAEADRVAAEVGELKKTMPELEERAQRGDAELRDILTGIPNLPHASVPVGK